MIGFPEMFTVSEKLTGFCSIFPSTTRRDQQGTEGFQE
jgi:hypothetical protein